MYPLHEHQPKGFCQYFTSIVAAHAPSIIFFIFRFLLLHSTLILIFKKKKQGIMRWDRTGQRPRAWAWCNRRHHGMVARRRVGVAAMWWIGWWQCAMWIAVASASNLRSSARVVDNAACGWLHAMNCAETGG